MSELCANCRHPFRWHGWVLNQFGRSAYCNDVDCRCPGYVPGEHEAVRR